MRWIDTGGQDMGRRIFIHHDGALGDMLLSLPALEALRGPDDFIYLAGRRDVVDLLKRFGYIAAGADSGSQAFLPFFTGCRERGLRDLLSGFDDVYVFSAVGKSEGVAAGIHLSFPGSRVIKTISPPKSGVHVSDFRRNQIDSGSLSGAHAIRLAVPPACQEEARVMLKRGGHDFGRPLVAIQPGSGSRKKCWPIRNFEELADNLRERHNCFLVILSGPAESGEMEDEIADYSRGNEESCLHISGHDLTTVASILSLSDLYIGNDSGITHLAASVMNGGIVAVFGPTDPVLWGPRARGVVIISSDMECAPCETVGPESHFRRVPEDCGIKCLSEIPVRNVLDKCVFSVA